MLHETQGARSCIIVRLLYVASRIYVEEEEVFRSHVKKKMVAMEAQDVSRYRMGNELLPDVACVSAA